MKSVDPGKLKTRLTMVVCAYVLVTAVQWYQKDIYKMLDASFVDRLAALSMGPPASGSDGGGGDPVVYIDANFYYDRSYHARVIENLAALKIRAQFVDFVFEENLGDDNDERMIAAIAAAGSVYLGISFESLDHPMSGVRDQSSKPAVDYMDRTKWWVDFESPPDDFYIGHNIRMTASRLATVARGSGFLNLPADADGVLRSIPLLVRYRGAVYPSLSLQAACDYLGISQADIVVDPGENITLKGAKTSPDAPPRDIVIPIDDCGRMLINFDSARTPIRHYSYRDVYRAFEDRSVSKRLRQELPGKIAIIAENVEADVNVRPARGQRRLTSGAVHAVAVRNILEETFLCRLSEGAGKAVEIILLAGVFGVSVIFSSIGLILGTLTLAGFYLAGGVFSFSGLNTIVPFTAPMLMAAIACILILIAMAVERAVLLTRTEKAKQLAEHELDIGRQIQSGFFPTTLPETDGWEIAAHFKAAHHVSGDFYDAFYLEKPRYVGMVIGDVCDKGVGAALYMAIFRSLVRILSRTSAADNGDLRGRVAIDPAPVLKRTIRSINDYISVTHEKDGMFATIFFGILDAETGELAYINAGHEPPLIVGNHGIKAQLMPTGTAVGAYPDLAFEVKTIHIGPGETLLGYTDGVTDARNPAGQSFTRERLVESVAAHHASPGRMIEDINTEIENFAGGEALFDDITLLAVGRYPTPHGKVEKSYENRS